MILNFSGKNQVLMLDKMKFNIINFFVFSRIKIKGKNNKIIFRGDFKLSNFFNVLRNLKLVIRGDNNLVDIEFPIIFRNATISLSKDNNIFKIKRTEHKLKDASFYIEDGGIVDIGESSQLGNGDLYVVVSQGYKNKPKLTLGNNVIIAKGAIIRTTDGHTLIDSISGKPVNEPEDIIIGNNVWITSRCTILKGAQIPDNSVVGASSVVNKKYTEQNTIIAGIPARVVKQNISWDIRHYDEFIDSYERQNNIIFY